MTCTEHTAGCGFSLKVGDVIFINGARAWFHAATWFFSCFILDSDGVMTCKVGYVKVLADDSKLVANRIGVVSSIHRRKGEVITNTMKGNIVARTKIKRKPRKVKSKGKNNGKTMEMCDTVGDYALMTLLDGGFPAYAQPLPSIQDEGPDLDDDDSSDGSADEGMDSESDESEQQRNRKKSSNGRGSGGYKDDRDRKGSGGYKDDRKRSASTGSKSRKSATVAKKKREH